MAPETRPDVRTFSTLQLYRAAYTGYEYELDRELPVGLRLRPHLGQHHLGILLRADVQEGPRRFPAPIHRVALSLDVQQDERLHLVLDVFAADWDTAPRLEYLTEQARTPLVPAVAPLEAWIAQECAAQGRGGTVGDRKESA